jgi:glucose-6-phosphate dehydrogenase assembly protein OpcA
MLLEKFHSTLQSSADACLSAIEDIEQARVEYARLGSSTTGEAALVIRAGWVGDCFQWTIQNVNDGRQLVLNQEGEREDSAFIASRLAAVLGVAYPTLRLTRLPG